MDGHENNKLNEYFNELIQQQQIENILNKNRDLIGMHVHIQVYLKV